VEEALRVLARSGDATPAAVLFKAKDLITELEALDPESADRSSLADLVSTTLATAIRELPAAQRRAAEALFGLDPIVGAGRIGERRAHAGEALGVSPGTFRNHQEPRLLKILAERVAFSIASPGVVAGVPTAGAEVASPSSVLVLSARGSIGALEIIEHLRSLGVHPLTFEETLERSGYDAPSLVDNLRVSVTLSQAVVVVLESQRVTDAADLALSAGMSLGLAPDKTIIVRLGDARLPVAMGGLNVLRLNNARESRAALSAALERAGCHVSRGSNTSTLAAANFATGWYRWTPMAAERATNSEIANAVACFESLDNDAGRAASQWLRDEALASYPATVTSVLVGGGLALGFVAMRAGTVRLTKGDRRSLLPGSTSGTDQGAAVIEHIARNRAAAPGVGEQLMLFAIGEALQAAEHSGAIALVIDPPDAASAELFVDRWHFRRSLRPGTSLWFPLSTPDAT
jgi:hypothetical protein